MRIITKVALSFFLCLGVPLPAQIIGYAPSVAELQTLIDGGVNYVVVRNPTPGTEYVQETPRTIVLRSGLTLLCERDVVIQAAPGAFKAATDVPQASLVSGTDLDGVTLLGCTFRMRRADYTVANGYLVGEWRHALSLKGCKNVHLSDIRLTESGGDGLYVGPSIAADGARSPCENIALDRVLCDHNYRQGLSVVSVKGLTVRDSQFDATQGTAPQAGIDIEPAHPLDFAQDIAIERCSARNNGGSAFQVDLRQQNKTSAPVSVAFKDNRGSGIPIGHQLIRLEGIGRNLVKGPPGIVTWDGTIWP